MKKIIAILLIPIFLLTTAGMAITSLYCKGTISKIGVSIKACCEDVDKGGCCKTTSKVVKVEDDFTELHSAPQLNKLIDFYLPETKIITKPEVSYNTTNFIYWDKAPPISKDRLYILFRSLII